MIARALRVAVLLPLAACDVPAPTFVATSSAQGSADQAYAQCQTEARLANPTLRGADRSDTEALGAAIGEGIVDAEFINACMAGRGFVRG